MLLLHTSSYINPLHTLHSASSSTKIPPLLPTLPVLTTDITMSSSLRPGVMICTPSLHDPTPANAEIFLRWTKLHNRELLGLPAAPNGGKITRALRFARPHALGGVGEYVLAPSPIFKPLLSILQREIALGQTCRYVLSRLINLSRYFYTILANDIAFWHSDQYHEGSRRLDLENTRTLGEGEEPVGCEQGKMVWDVCDAKFSIYEEVQSSDDELEVKAYPSHPRSEGDKRKWLVGLNGEGDENDARKVQKELVGWLRGGLGVESVLYSSLYRHGGKEAQPDKHPAIEEGRVGSRKWLLIVLVVGGDEDGVEELVEEWGEGVEVGVWRGEVDMV